MARSDTLPIVQAATVTVQDLQGRSHTIPCSQIQVIDDRGDATYLTLNPPYQGHTTLAVCDLGEVIYATVTHFGARPTRTA